MEVIDGGVLRCSFSTDVILLSKRVKHDTDFNRNKPDCLKTLLPLGTNICEVRVQKKRLML
jgi:hypothetical protein